MVFRLGHEGYPDEINGTGLCVRGEISSGNDLDAVILRNHCELRACPAVAQRQADRELERRCGLAKARREWEQSRKALLVDYRGAQGRAAPRSPNPELARMTLWVQSQRDALESILNPSELMADLQKRKLFRETDDLDDPLGEPTEPRFW